MSIQVKINDKYISVDNSLIDKLAEDNTFLGFRLDSKNRVVALFSDKKMFAEELLIDRPKGFKVTFKDGDRHNLILSNLGLEPKTKIKGVYYYPKNQMRKWKAIISVNGKKKALGYFSTEKEAKEAYEKAAKELKGL
jgi:hypothetical protein